MAVGAANLPPVSVEQMVLDASALVDLLESAEVGPMVESRIEWAIVHAPAHLDAEVLSSLGRLTGPRVVRAAAVAGHLERITAAPVERHAVAALLAGAWRRRQRLRLADALYVELAEQLGVRLVTTDPRLGRAVQLADVVTA